MPHRPISSIIQTRTTTTAPAHLTVAAAAQLMREMRIGALPVVQGERLVGVFTERDALFRVIAGGRDPATTTVGEVMTTQPVTIAPDRPLGHALHLMFEGEFRHVPVVRDGRVVGMVSARDALGPELKEFVAEIDTREHLAEIL